jgi:hypothetical protein
VDAGGAQSYCGSLEVVVSAIQLGKAIWCTDGSFDRLAQPDISSEGWVISDPETKHHIRGSFYEISGPTAGSYCGELLGLTALHLVAVARLLNFWRYTSGKQTIL